MVSLAKLNRNQKIASNIISFLIFIYLIVSLYLADLLTTGGILVTAFGVFVNLISNIFSEWVNKQG